METNSWLVFVHGLSGSGKSTISVALNDILLKEGYNTVYIDGDTFRNGVSSDLTFNLADREENIRRLMEVAKILLDNNIDVIISCIAPTEFSRNIIRDNITNLIEVYCECSIEKCVDRDPKKLYSKPMKHLTGVNHVFEPPVKQSLTVNTEYLTMDECVKDIIDYFNKKVCICSERIVYSFKNKTYTII